MKKVDSFTKQIAILKNIISDIKRRIVILNNLEWIEFKGDKEASYERFLINEDSRFKLEQPLEVFKTLALKELEKELKVREKELNDFIKKGIIDND